jgi:hypothetical protein
MSSAFSSPTWLLIVAILTGLSACSEGPGSIVTPPAPVASVTVDPAHGQLEPGETVQLGATPRSETGAELSPRTVTWQSLDASIATVTTAGLVSAVAPGSVTITASSEGRNGTALIAVRGPVASVTILPESPTTILQGEGVPWQVQVRDTGANVLQRAIVSWSSSDPAVATVDAHGNVLGVAAGAAEIAATAGGISGTAVVTVRPAPDLSGVWSMAEQAYPLGEPGGCNTSGPATLTQPSAALTVAGTYHSSGECELLRAHSVDLGGDRVVTGIIAGPKVSFRSSGAMFCDYQGTIEGDPVSRIEGSMECDVPIFLDGQRVIGTFTMTR